MISPSITRARCSPDRVAVVGGLGDRGVGVGAEQQRVRAVDAGQPQRGEGLATASGSPRRRPGSVSGGFDGACPDAARSRPRRSRRRPPGPRRTRSCLAASLTGCQSESLAPRSTSSTSCRSSANGTRSSTSGWSVRARAITPRPAPRVAEVAGADGGQRRRRPGRRRRPPGGRPVPLEGAAGLLLDARPRRRRRSGRARGAGCSLLALLFRLPMPSEPSAAGAEAAWIGAESACRRRSGGLAGRRGSRPTARRTGCR